MKAFVKRARAYDVYNFDHWRFEAAMHAEARAQGPPRQRGQQSFPPHWNPESFSELPNQLPCIDFKFRPGRAGNEFAMHLDARLALHGENRKYVDMPCTIYVPLPQFPDTDALVAELTGSTADLGKRSGCAIVKDLAVRCLSSRAMEKLTKDERFRLRSVYKWCVRLSLPTTNCKREGGTQWLDIIVRHAEKHGLLRVFLLLDSYAESHGDNWCVQGHCRATVRLSNGSTAMRAAHALRAGDVVLGMNRWARILATVKTVQTNRVAMVQLGALSITDEHPVLMGDTWRLPKSIARAQTCNVAHLHNFVLEPIDGLAGVAREAQLVGAARNRQLESSRPHSITFEGVDVVTLGHGLPGPILFHPFWATSACVDFLLDKRDWPNVTLSS